MKHRVRAAAVIGMLCLSSLGSAGVAQAGLVVRHTWRVNLDGDPHIERVQLMLAPGKLIHRRWLRVVDQRNGSRVVVRVSPRIEWLARSDVKIRDLNAHPRRKEIFYLGYIGGTAGSPTYAGIRGWNGATKHAFWTYAPPYRVRHHNGHRYFYDGASIKLAQLPSTTNPAYEINLHQAELTGNAPLCCPQYEFIRHYQYNPATRSWVVYQRRWRKL